MTEFDRFLDAASGHSEGFEGGDLPMPPARPVAVLTCMDARLDPASFPGLSLGDAHVIRNAGGRASDDAVRSLVISQRLLGTTEVAVIHHTDCGMLTFTDEDLVAKIRDDLGVDASGRGFLPFSDLEDGLREDVETLRRSELIPDDIPIAGGIYDVKTGNLTEVIRK